MTDTYQPLRDRAARGRCEIPEWVVVAEMDRAIKLAEDSKRIHDTLAQELGYERTRIENVKAGDVIGGYEWREVKSIELRSIHSGHHFFWVTYTDHPGPDEFAPDDMVSRQLPLPPARF